MGGFFAGITQGLSDELTRTQEQIRKEEAQRDAEEQDVLKAMLHSDSPAAQRYALASLLQNPKERKKASKGLRGWLGETERTPHYQQLTELEKALQGPPQAQQVQPVEGPAPLPERVDRLVGAPEAPQVDTGAPVPGTGPAPFRFEGNVVPPEMSDEAVLGPAPAPPTGYLNIPREVQAQYTQAMTQHGQRGRDLQHERDAYRKELEASARRVSEKADERKYQEVRDTHRDEMIRERERIRDDRTDARQRRTDNRIERMAKEARGETSKRDTRRFYQQDKRDEQRRYDAYVKGLNKYGTAEPADLAEAKIEHEKTLMEIEKDYGEELRQGGVPVPKDLGKSVPFSGTVGRFKVRVKEQ